MHSSDYPGNPSPSQPPQPPRKRQRHGWRLARNIVLGALGAFILLIILLSVFAPAKPAPVAAGTPVSVPAVPAPDAPVTAAPSSTAPAAPQTLLTFTGHGKASTPVFTASGDYSVSWIYSGNVDSTSGTPMADNFSMTLNTAGQGQDSSFSGPNDIQVSGSGNQTVSGDSGSHYLTVQANGASTWTVKVVTVP